MDNTFHCILKRIGDIILSTVGLMIFFPVWIITTIVIIIESGGPVLISQERIGKDFRRFYVLKFRSMDKNAHNECPTNHIGENSERITRVGSILRATAMDELPQLLSIFIGDMSFVGPRPVHPKETIISGSRFESIKDVYDFDKRCLMEPGLTGIAQVYAKKNIPIENKVKYDILYLKKHNFYLDVRLILLSFWRTFRGGWGNKHSNS